jgi:hypothetical protein
MYYKRNSPDAETCFNCKFYRHGAKDTGLCRYYPPTPVGLGIGLGARVLFKHPEVHEDNFCGKFKKGKEKLSRPCYDD